MPTEYVFLNDRIVDASDATVSAFDVGFTHGAGLFETFRAYNGVPFRLQAHLDRMAASSRALSIAIPQDPEFLRDAVRQVLSANDLHNARMRLTVSAGDPRGRIATLEGSQNPSAPPFAGTVLVTAAQMQPHPPELYARGMTVFITPYKQTRHSPIAGHKTLNYFSRLVALREAQQHNCGEALWFTTENLLAEACISNVFIVTDGIVRTPPPETPVLPGVTRAVVLEAAAAAGIPTQQGPLTIDDLLGASEVFLTNTSMEVMPVTHVERHPVRDAKPGPVTRRLADLVRETVLRETAHMG